MWTGTADTISVWGNWFHTALGAVTFLVDPGGGVQGQDPPKGQIDPRVVSSRR